MKRLCHAVAVVLAVVCAGALVSAQTPAKSLILQKVIVRVNGEIFTQTDLEFRQVQTLKDQSRSVAKIEDLTADPVLIKALGQITPGILVDAVDELVFVQHGRELGAKFTDAQFNEFVKRIKEGNSIKDDATFQAALKDAGMTLADLRANAEKTFFIQTVQQRELMRNMTLTEDEARKYFTAHQDEFMKPSTVSLREIAINVPVTMVNGQATASVGAEEDAKAKIAAIRERALKGEDFVKLVAEASESGTKANGGTLGMIAMADLNPELAQILEKMKVGDITEPMRTKAGYQILKMESRSIAEVESFEKSRDQISQKILEARMDVEKGKLLVKLLAQAVIEWKDDAYKKMYETERAARSK